MLQLGWITVVVLLAQFEPDVAGTESYVFHVMRRGGPSETINALVEEAELEKTFGQFLTVVRDEPWLPMDQRQQRIRREDIVERYREVSSTRKKRLEAGWAEHGGIQIQTAEGLAWVFEDEYRLAQRAHELEREAFADHSAASATSAVIEDDAQGNRVGFLTLWGPHLAIVVATILLSVAVIAFTLVRRPWTGVKT